MTYLLISIAIMAGITYFIRALPVTLFQRKIKSIWVRSFLHYIPYAVLAALTFPSEFMQQGMKLPPWPVH